MAKTAVCSSLPDTSMLCYQSQDAMYGVNGIKSLSIDKECFVSGCVDSCFLVCCLWSVPLVIMRVNMQ